MDEITLKNTPAEINKGYAEISKGGMLKSTRGMLKSTLPPCRNQQHIDNREQQTLRGNREQKTIKSTIELKQYYYFSPLPPQRGMCNCKQIALYIKPLMLNFPNK